MRTIKLDENYYIDISELNFTLSYRREKEVQKKNKETGVEELKTVTEKSDWYYPSLKLCLKTYLNESLRSCESIEQVLQRISEVEQKIDKIK